MNALQKVDTELSERYTTTCKRCGWVRQFFGTAKEARASAELMGWEFRVGFVKSLPMMHMAVTVEGETYKPPFTYEEAFCPHCQLLTKETP